MINFITIFFSIYGAMHIYLLLKVENAFPVLRVRLFSVPLVAVLTASPFLVRIFEGGGRMELLPAMTWFSNIWMWLLFLFVSVAICSQVLLGIVARVHVFPGLKLEAGQRARLLFIGPMLLALGLAAYGWQEAKKYKA